MKKLILKQLEVYYNIHNILNFNRCLNNIVTKRNRKIIMSAGLITTFFGKSDNNQ